MTSAEGVPLHKQRNLGIVLKFLAEYPIGDAMSSAFPNSGDVLDFDLCSLQSKEFPKIYQEFIVTFFKEEFEPFPGSRKLVLKMISRINECYDVAPPRGVIIMLNNRDLIEHIKREPALLNKYYINSDVYGLYLPSIFVDPHTSIRPWAKS